MDELFASIRSSYPYRHLSRKAFDLVLSMLAGRYAETRLRELKPRISLDLVDNTVHGREGVERMIYTSGGTIPDRGYYDLRIEESHAMIGELDEEFVWERSIGDTFSLGAHVWHIEKITSQRRRGGSHRGQARHLSLLESGRHEPGFPLLREDPPLSRSDQRPPRRPVPRAKSFSGTISSTIAPPTN